jgi:hypothetical protein
MQKWEYMVLIRTYNYRTSRFDWSDNSLKGKSGQEVLNELGQHGLELISTPECSTICATRLC